MRRERIGEKARKKGVGDRGGRGNQGMMRTLKLYFVIYRTSLVAQMVKRLSTLRETRVQSLGWEDPLEKEMAIHSSTLAWKIPWTEEPSRLQSMGSQSWTRLSDFTHSLTLLYTRGG